MNNDLREQFVHAMFRAKRADMNLPQMSEVNMSEIFVMGSIAANASNSENNINVPGIQSNLHITKAAVSQILGTLENKGYVIRETDKTNRRKITVTLTSAGEKVLDKAKKIAEQRLDQIITSFGEEKMSQLLNLFEELVDVSEKLKQDSL